MLNVVGLHTTEARHEDKVFLRHSLSRSQVCFSTSHGHCDHRFLPRKGVEEDEDDEGGGGQHQGQGEEGEGAEEEEKEKTKMHFLPRTFLVNRRLEKVPQPPEPVCVTRIIWLR